MPRSPHRFYHSLVFKLFLVALTLLAIPWAGVRFIQETESFLRKQQEQGLLTRARNLAALVQAQGDVLPAANSSRGKKRFYLHRLSNPIQVDGYTDDWQTYWDQAITYPPVPASYTGAQFKLLLGLQQAHFYVLLRVTDPHLLYAKPNAPATGDGVLLKFSDGDGRGQTFLLETSAPGWVEAKVIANGQQGDPVTAPEPRIRGEWQETAGGYNLELRLPWNLLPQQLEIVLSDRNPGFAEPRLITTGPRRLVHTDPELESLIKGATGPATRAWVVDEQRHVLARSGQLRPLSKPEAYDDDKPIRWSGILRGIIRLALPYSDRNLVDEPDQVGYLNEPAVTSAIQGQAGVRRRTTSQGTVIAAAWPVTKGESIVGAVALEETTDAILALQFQAMERLVILTLAVFLLTAGSLLFFAARLTSRIRKLRNRVNQAINADGRIISQVTTDNSRDEIGDLGHSFSQALGRLEEYNRYLEALRSRLGHELRTPLSIIRSSLENMSDSALSREHQTLMQRADQGVRRLSSILDRLQEATRLEQAMQQAELQQINLNGFLVAACGAYRLSQPEQEFQLYLPTVDLRLNGDPELLGQALDKIVTNALDFHVAGTAITIELALDNAVGPAVIRITNRGPLLDDATKDTLFQSMTSFRRTADDMPHLGLGLYLVRLICEFHQGRAEAANLADGSGVCFSLHLPANVAS